MSRYVGKPVQRYEGIGHVTGRTTYVDDIKLPGMLYAKVLHSPVHKGIIKSIDVSAAENAPGVVAVITAKDIPGENSVAAPDEPVFVEKHIRFKGERIAAVAAVNEEAALDAIKKIKVDIEEQTPVFDPLEAMKPEAPKVRPEGNLWQFNSGECRVLRKGDIEKGFAEADEIVEERFIHKMNDHAAMEPPVSIAFISGDDRLMIHTVSQAFHFHLSQLVKIFNLPVSKVCLIGGTVGGGFGGKNLILCDHVAGLLALKTKRPVKYRMTRKEDILFTPKRGAYIFDYKCGIKNDGQFVACKILAVHDIGAYQTHGEYAIEKPCLYITGPYRCPNVWYDGYAVFTNKPQSGSMRGFNIINVTHTSEMMMNKMAEAIGMDPWEIRFRNAWVDGDTGPTMWKVTAAGLIESMIKAAELGNIELPPRLKKMNSRGSCER